MLAVLLAASVAGSSVLLPVSAEELLPQKDVITEEGGVAPDVPTEEEESASDEAIVDEEGAGSAPSEDGDSISEADPEEAQNDGLILQMEEVEDPQLAVEEQADASHTITTAAELPTEIGADETYVLGADITLTANQQITSLAGTLDGQGHTITLAGSALAKEVSGTIQNLGVAGTITVTAGYKGSIAETLTGTLQNSYSTAHIEDNWNTVGGLVGTLAGGQVRNCYYAAELEMGNGGVAAYVGTGTSRPQVSNCYFQSGTWIETIAMGAANADISNCAEKSADDLKTEATVALLNTSIPATGYVFAVASDGGFPVLVKGVAEISWGGLETVLETVTALEDKQAEYTEETWKALSDAAAAGKELLAQKDSGEVTQDAINAAAKAIEDAITGLRRQPTVEPVTIPENAIRISSQSDFSKMENAKGKYFVLTQDITIDSNYAYDSDFMNYSSFAGVLDGQGHTITFENAGAIFGSLAAGAVVQNVNVTGMMTGSGSSVTGPFGGSAYGASILNCRSDITGSNVAGFIGKTGVSMGATAADDSTGVIANCIAVGDTGKGALCSTSSNNSGEAIIQGCYWVDTLGSGAGARSEEDLKTMEIVNALNAAKGANGISWGQGSDGYPYFGEDQPYTPGSYQWPETGEGKFPVAFLAYNAQQAVTVTDGHLELTPDAVDANGKIAGTFSLQGYEAPEDCSLSWSFTQRKPESAFAVYDGGIFCIYGTGTAVLTATQNNADGTSEVLASVAVHSIRQQLTDIRLYIDGEDVTDGSYTVQGSDYKTITVKAKYSGSDEYQDVSYSAFTYTADENGQKLLGNRVTSSSGFSFKEAGTAVLTVTSRNQPDMHKSVTVTSAYVPVESVVPAISGTQTIHSRNANSDGQETDGRVAFNPILGSAIVTPANATNADKVVITSDDPDGTIAYYTSGEKGYVPKQAGTVTFTATIEDTDPTTGKTISVSGSSTVTFEYKNNVKEISLNNTDKEITVEAGTTGDEFTVNVTGELDEEGYDVTEPALKWTYSERGIAQVLRTGSGHWKKNIGSESGYDESDPDYGYYLPTAKYQVMGLSEGTVVATGTPIDTKNGAEPVTITITVTKGSQDSPDFDEIVTDGGTSAAAYISGKHTEGYGYGNEWLIYALLQRNEAVSDTMLDQYYASVAATVKNWKNPKPTDIERTALALARMGKDITDVDGVNLAAMIYNSDRLADGSNEVIYALLALDAADIAIPADAKWNRETMISEILSYQSAGGGFGLTNNKSASVDITAMALQALANYQNRPQIQTAIASALEYLKTQQQDDFGYGNAESTAQVLLALTSLGIDPTSQEAGFGTPNFNLITNLMGYQKEDGGFSHLTTGNSQEMSTVQALQALDAYRTRKDGAYWNVNGQKDTITVSLLGDTVHDSDQDGNVHVLAKGNLTVWAAAAEYRVRSGATAMDVIDALLAANGMTGEKRYGGTYLASVTTREGITLGEFTNGKNSGWLYSVNGADPEVGACDYDLQDGDVVVLHYTDNYEKENEPAHTHVWSSTWNSDANAHWHACTAGGCDVTQNSAMAGYGAHTWNEGTVTAPATCTHAGVKTYTCTVCGATKTGAIPAKGHSFGAWVTKVEATVFAAQQQERLCSVCGEKQTQTVGTALTPTMKTNAEKLPLKVKQKTTAFKVSGLANGDSVKSYTSSNTKVFTVSKNGTLTAGKKTGKATLTVTLASGLAKKIPVTVQKGTVTTTRITGLKSKVTVKKGKKLALKPVLTPITSQQKFTYASSNKKVATVSKSGVITAKKAGTAKITVKSGKKKFVVTVTVPKTKTTAIIGVPATINVKKGKTYTLKAKLSPKGSEEKLTYSSSNKKIATVSKSGKIKGVKKGTVTITVKSGKVTAKCQVTVK